MPTRSNLEAESGELGDQHADLEILRNHLDVYNAVVERGSFLWDALSTHMPIRRGGKLGDVHEAIELLHQTLLQAVADLGHIGALIWARLAVIDRAAEELRARYDEHVVERRPPNEQGVRTALTETGLFEQIKRFGQEAAAEMERVKRSYDELLRAMASAFDERRAREGDKLQNGATVLGAAAAALGIVTILDAVVRMAPDGNSTLPTLLGGPAWLSPVAAVVCLVLMGVLFGFLGVGLRWYVRLGRLGSRQFRKQYGGGGRWSSRTGVWRFLMNYSTDALEHRSDEVEVEESEAVRHGKWQLVDIMLSRDFARHWDEAMDAYGHTRDGRAKRDIKNLSRQVEQWGLISLLITERARRLYPYRLPRLTCLLRCCDRIEGSFLRFSYVPAAIVVSTVDFVRSMHNAGISREQALRLDQAIRGKRYDSAAEALQACVNGLKEVAR